MPPPAAAGTNRRVTATTLDTSFRAGRHAARLDQAALVALLATPLLLLHAHGFAEASIGVVDICFLARSAIARDWGWMRTTWLRIVAFNGIGSACAEHLKKGDGVYVEGRLQIREYEDKDHVERTAVEVVASKVRFLGRGRNAGDEQRPTPGQPRTHAGQRSTPTADMDQTGADDVPF